MESARPTLTLRATDRRDDGGTCVIGVAKFERRAESAPPLGDNRLVSAQAMTAAMASATASMLRLFSAARQIRPVDTA